MSLPIASDGNAAMMAAGMKMLQAPEFLQQIAAGSPTLSDDDQPSIEELLLKQQEMYADMFGEETTSNTTSNTTFNYDPRRPDMLGVPMQQKPSVYDKYLVPFYDKYMVPFFGLNSGAVPNNRFNRRQGLGSGGLAEIQDNIREMYRNFGIASLMEEAYSLGVDQLPYVYDSLGVSGFFNEGGSVTVDKDDGYKMLQLSDEDAYLRGEMLGDDNPRYNYTLGLNLSDIMPGLSAEFGVRDDAIMNPGMMSPDDEKFFKLLYNF